MILSDGDITKALYMGDLRIDPAPVYARLQPASVELTLGTEFRRLDGSVTQAGPGEWVYLERGGFMLGHTAETVTIPNYLVAEVNGKSSWGRRGLLTHATAGFVDPGFCGQLTLEFANLGSEDLYLKVGDPICQLVFTRLTSPALRSYGTEGLGSHYMGQTGATGSRA